MAIVVAFRSVSTIVVLLGFLYGLTSGQSCSEGAETLRNNMYYRCQSGRDVPIACAASDGSRINPGSSYVSNRFRFVCQQPHTQLYVLTPVACIKDNQEIRIGSTMDDRSFWYTCSQENNQVAFRVSGCVGDGGARVGANGIVTRNPFLFRCVPLPDNGFQVQGYGCVVDGAHYPAGREIISGPLWYECNVSPQNLELKVAGCIQDGQKLRHGETAARNSFLYQCMISADRAELNIVGCVDGRGGQHRLGETWREGTGDVQYVIECRREGRSVMMQARQCYYQGHDGQGPLERNCVRRFGTTMVKCVSTPNGGLTVNMIRPSTDDDLRNAVNAGFRNC